MSNPYIPVRIQNQALSTGLSGMVDYYSMERNEFTRKNERLPILGYIQSGLLVLYGVVFFVMLLVLFLRADMLSLHIKLLIVAIFALYPFFIYNVENAVVQMYYYIYAVIYGYSYHEIIARKGLQNNKKFQDAANFTYANSTQAFVIPDQSATQGSQLHPLISTLPDLLVPQFTQYADFVQNRPSNIQSTLTTLAIDLNTSYTQFIAKMPTITLNNMQTEMNNFSSDMNKKIKDTIKQLQGTISIADADAFLIQISQLNAAIMIQMLLYFEQNVINQLLGALKGTTSSSHSDTMIDLTTITINTKDDIVTLLNGYNSNISNLMHNCVLELKGDNTGDTIKSTITKYKKLISTESQNLFNKTTEKDISPFVGDTNKPILIGFITYVGQTLYKELKAMVS